MRLASSEIEAVFLTHRAALLAFFRSRGLDGMAEDLLHDLWMRLPTSGSDIETPINYLYRMANHIIIDYRRKQGQGIKRDTVWSEVSGPGFADRSEQPAADRVMVARQTAQRVLAVLDGQGSRVALIFRRHRIDGLTQREVAAELGVSVGTVEGDLRRAYRALVAFRERDDEE